VAKHEYMLGPPSVYGPVRGESLRMLGVEAERMADHVVGHHPTMLGAGKTKHAVDSNSRLEDRLHPCIMTIVLRLCKTMAAVEFSPRVLRHNCSNNSSTVNSR